MSHTAHSLQIRLAEARRAYEAAQAACPHWDCEGDSGDHGCCVELYEAERELHLARKAVSAVARARTAIAAAEGRS